MMYLKLPVIDKRYTPKYWDTVHKKIANNVQEEFAYYMAEQIKNYLKQVIKNQTYKQYWKPLSVDYMEYKRRHHLSLNIWEATSLLVDSIQVRKYGDHYIIGFPLKKKYPGTNITVTQVAIWMEYGTTGKHPMPARPLFNRVYEYHRKNVDRHFRKFLATRRLTIVK